MVKGTSGSSAGRVWIRRAVRVFLVLVLSGVAGIYALYAHYGDETWPKLLRKVGLPNVGWPESTPADEAIDGGRLAELEESLMGLGGRALLVIRHGKVVAESYAPGVGPNSLFWTAAEAKATVGVMALMIAASRGYVSLDDPLATYVPQLRDDPLRSRIRLVDLAFHQAGLDDVRFPSGPADRLDGWKKVYYEHPADRFRMALFETPMLYEPGTEQRYSGVGYYALAYALTVALQETPYRDLKTFLEQTLFGPLGIPEDARRLSYGESYSLNGMRLYAIGSGSAMTPRATARIAQLMLQGGRWRGQQLIDPDIVRRVLARDDLEKVRRGGGAELVSTHHGWVVNVLGKWPSLPADAYVGLGGKVSVVVVVPSLDLVAVFHGRGLAEEGESEEEALDRLLFAPLIAAVRAPLPKMAGGEALN